MKLSNFEQALLSSKGVVKSVQERPKLSAIEIELLPDQQRLESYFSDVIHMLSVTKGELPIQKINNLKGKQTTRLIKRVTWDENQALTSWIRALKLEEVIVDFQGSDIQKASVAWESTRTFLSSSLENDLKYRLSIHEFYMDRTSLALKFIFNSTSQRQVRAREALLRLNYMPVRLVSRLVNKA